MTSVVRFTLPLRSSRQARHQGSVTRRARGEHVARPRTRPPVARRESASAREPLRHTLPRSHPPLQGSPAFKKRTVKKKKGRGRRNDDDTAIKMMMYAPPGPLRSSPQCARRSQAPRPARGPRLALQTRCSAACAACAASPKVIKPPRVRRIAPGPAASFRRSTPIPFLLTA